jgi:iron complex transport system permease protein
VNKKILLLFFLFILVASSVIVALKSGAISSSDPQAGIIIRQLRLPRLVLALLVGAGLSCCGVSLQALLRNSLAEPYTLGISSGAALGASLSILFKLGGAYTTGMSFLGSTLTIFLVYSIASYKKFTNNALILSGVALGLVFSSVVLLIIALVKQEGLSNAVIWLMGDLSKASFENIFFSGAIIIIGVLTLIALGRDIDVICLGDEKARYLGLDIISTKKIIFFVISLITAACVSASGIIGFVGLIIPHIARFVFGAKHRLLLIASGLLGAGFLVLCDTISRTILLPLELPVGVITGIFGGIFFLALLIKSKNWEIT